jgi:hypothetical protein
MKRILITNRRYGSTLVHKYIESANKFEYVIPIDFDPEFFNPIFTSFNVGDNFSSIELKIKFLEEQRKKGIEYSHKINPIDIHNFNIKDWFDEFYKDWEKVILHRRNKWNPFLSYYVQENLAIANNAPHWVFGSTHSYWDDPVEEKIIRKLKPFYITHRNIEYFWYNEDLLNTWDGTKIYLEDHMPDAHNSLCSYFDVNIPQKLFKIKLDYEKYVLNLAEAKDWFYRYGV